MNSNFPNKTSNTASADYGFIHRRLMAFVWAGRGVLFFFQTQVHAWVHLAATGVVVTAGLYWSVSASDWALLLLATGLVWTTEAVNTAIELTVDLASPEFHERAGKAKDVAAAAVLLAAITAVCIAVCVFLPYIVATI